MKKIAMKTAILLAAMTTLGTASAAVAQDLKTITPGIISVGSDQVYPPYDYLEDGVTKGFDADVMAVLAPKLGVKVQFMNTRFASLIPASGEPLRYDRLRALCHARPCAGRGLYRLCKGRAAR
ncbi:transporter substrate-binding domain-containing protein (plasmid) [Rhizobium sp. ZK1]|uniref:transporter substrate-binding domain-containing protein n=1 Tax=Rhizobium sp. ZK1 TaxID=3389872 RepID=UPI0039F66CD1